MLYPDFKTFKKLARHGNLIPICLEVLADTETPVTAFLKIARTDPDCFLLESVEGGEKVARYTFLGTRPKFILTSRDGQAFYQSENTKKIIKTKKNPLEVVRLLLNKYRPVRLEGLPRFTGGAVGFFSYDLVNYFEKLPRIKNNDLGLPDFQLMFMDTIVIFDHARHTLKIIANAYTGSGSCEQAYKKALARIGEMAVRLNTPASPRIFDPFHSLQLSAAAPPAANFSKEKFCQAVKKTLGYIRSGDIIQAVISRRFSKKVSAEPFDIYRILRNVNPSPYMFYLSFGNFKLIGASPEVMVRCEDKEVTIRPIAGTRPRGDSPAEDLKLEQELKNDEKEKAEHIMLVDLARNDIGRVCEYNSVVVDELMVVEKYSHVMHLVSNVEGKLKKGLDALDVLAASFPAGTVSGAPKIRAMEIIAELEPTVRGAYAGAVGYLDFSGNLDTCITIRTILLKEGTAYIQAGAGIVADSVPEKEYQETLNKAGALLKTIEAAEKVHQK
jgi:anthranilate synthase component 1